MDPLSDATLSKTLLVVDDIPSARKIVVRILSKLGFKQIKEASSIAEATLAIDNNYLGLIITDVHLKDGEGFALLDELKTRERAVPIIFITSDMESDSFEKAKKLGQKIGYLLKPFSPHVLASKIEELLL